MISFEYRQNFRNIIISKIGTNDEVWAFHPRYANIVVSSFGRVKNFFTDYIIAQRETEQGYRSCTIGLYQTTGIKRNKSALVHRLVAETFFSYLNCVEYEVNHINGDKSNNSIMNLNWMTRAENLDHALELGLIKPRFGKDNGMYKYTDDDIKALDELRKEGYTFKQLGNLLGISGGSVHSLLNRRIYE